MSEPTVVVIPFGVPAEGRGLGLGLAALVHGFVQVRGDGVALAQLRAHAGDAHGEEASSPVEAFVPPAAWRDIVRRGETSGTVGLVLTGSFEPPINGPGEIQLLVFDAKDGQPRARVDAAVDGDSAGATLVGALEELWSHLGGEIGTLRGLGDLGWEPLESVLRAERCVLYDPVRGGPHDRLAALLHLGRAIGDAPGARYPAERLATIALGMTTGSPIDPKLAQATLRALERGATDAIDSPGHIDLVETIASLQLRLGRPQDAERRMNAAIAIGPARPRPYALLAQALRAQGKLDSALQALRVGLEHAPTDPLLWSERGTVLALAGDLDAADAAWRRALASDHVHRAAFGGLAALALRSRDTGSAQSLVDTALSEPRAHPDVLRSAVQLVLGTEAQGLPRAARVARLCGRILDHVPNDAQASVALARAQIVLGERDAARSRLAEVGRMAPGSAAAAEAQMAHLALRDPSAELELQSILRAAHAAASDHLADVATRARRLATLHSAWTGWLAAAIAERRQGRWVAARGALELALELAPGAPPVHVELASVLLELDDGAGALSHVERALALEGESPRGLTVLSRALAKSGRIPEARNVVKRALAIRPDDADARAVLAQLEAPVSAKRTASTVGGIWSRWRRW